MQNIEKSKEVQFYLDRTIDATVRIMRSIVQNPTLSVEDRLEAMRKIADFHGSVALDLQRAIYGQEVSISLKPGADSQSST